jgi:tetratricopeptide (TPR) repeat protein
MDASAIAEVLERMNRDPSTAVDADLAREIAEREGVKAIVAGDVGMLGRGYVVSAQLVSSADGGVLVALRETADDDGEIIAAVDRLSAAGDLEGAISLLEEAIILDSTFAMAYRKLAVLLTNSFAPRSQINAAATLAFELRDRLPAIERNLAAAYYYAYVEYDQAKEAAAYRSVLQVDPDQTTALNNLSIILQAQRRYEDAEELLRHAVELDPTGSAFTFNLAWTQYAGGRIDAARQSINRYAEAVPGNPYALFLKSWLASAEHDYLLADSYIDSVNATQGASLTWRSFVSGTRAAHAETRGQLGRAERQLRANMSVEEEAGDRGAYLQAAAEIARVYATYRDEPAQALRIMDEAIERHPLDEMEPTDRPYATMTRLYVVAGDLQEARRLLAEYEREVPEGVRRGAPFRHAAAGDLALSEGRVQDALTAYRAWYDETGCTNCALFELGRAYEMAGHPDSALAMYDRAAEAPGLTRIYGEYDTVAQTYKRLGELYEERGDGERAVDYYNQFVELWDDADQELQPVVRDVRARIARLVGET